jgi:hypothetical protein
MKINANPPMPIQSFRSTSTFPVNGTTKFPGTAIGHLNPPPTSPINDVSLLGMHDGCFDPAMGL